MIVDCFTFNDEFDLLELRLSILDPYVDQFVIVESRTTFADEAKPLHFQENRDKFKKWEHKIKHYVNEGIYTDEEMEQARISPNTGGSPRWMNEFLQKEQIQKALTHLDEEDIVFVGDVDEIWSPEALKGIEGIKKLKLRVYTYYLNLRSNEEFWGTIKARYKDIKGQCLNHLRNAAPEKNTKDYEGWHFTSQGGLEAVKKKLKDQYNIGVFDENAENSLQSRFGVKDFIGRDFKLEVDESEWPTYLKENREKYKHLLKPTE